jgi:competence protein ComGC
MVRIDRQAFTEVPKELTLFIFSCLLLICLPNAKVEGTGSSETSLDNLNKQRHIFKKMVVFIATAVTTSNPVI